MLEITALTEAMLTVGFKQVEEITPIDLTQSGRPVVRGLARAKVMSIEMMLEIVDLKRQGEAMIEYCSRPSTVPAVGMLTLKNEWATWK